MSTSKHRGRAQHRVLGAYALQLVRLVARWGVPPCGLLDGVGLREGELAEPGMMLPLETVEALLERAWALTGEPALGIYLGLSKRVTDFGPLGFAAMSAESYGRALDLAIRYVPLVTTVGSLRLEVDGGVASLHVDEHTAAGGRAREIGLIGMLVGLRKVGADITAGRLSASIDLAVREPAYYARFANLVPRVRFGQPVNRMTFDASALALPLELSNPAALRLATEQCEHALEALGPHEALVARVRRALVGRDGFRSLREVAGQLHLSSRTLTRMLAELRTSFADLVDQEREKKALRLLSTSDLPLDTIAEQLDYSTVSNFARAFHRWTGETPGAYRRRSRGPGAAVRARAAAPGGVTCSARPASPSPNSYRRRSS
ncbi:MAG TPA: AraC family transcriptional regulator [Gaiellaceae bacterium]|nr:AraC family transcriptional regulator [Gaiellaceae bacterium]